MSKLIVISGANIRKGGPLEIFKYLLKNIENYLDDYKVIALVSDDKLFYGFDNFDFIVIRRYNRTFLHKLYYEYYWFRKFSKKRSIHLWLSINDVTPNVKAKKRAVYCHNATPFYSRSYIDIFYPSRALLQSFYYAIFYSINLKQNDYVIVQQEWFKSYFNLRFNISREKILVSKPEVLFKPISNDGIQDPFPVITFIYPTKAEPYKNIQVILKAAEYLKHTGINDFSIILTISPNDNRFSKYLYSKYSKLDNIKWVGYQLKKDLDTYYLKSNCLLFASTLETWGLPLSEFKELRKPIISIDLPYAKETIGNYHFVNYFFKDDYKKLAELIHQTIKGTIIYDRREHKTHESINYNASQLLKKLLK